MMYDGMMLANFGKAKVTKWEESLSRDAKLKTLVYRGRVRASVAVPQIRAIEADIVIKGRNKEEVSKIILDIVAWLETAGVARLNSPRDENMYYMAACTAISTPEYTANAATLTVEFTCSDHRPYSVATDEPIGDSETDLSNFAFNGEHCLTDMGCVFVESKRELTAGVRAIKYEISGRSGTIRYNTGNPILEEKLYTGVLYFVNAAAADGLMAEAAITQRCHEVAQWLINAERATLIMDSDTLREYQAEVISAVEMERDAWENGALKIKFILQPISKDVAAKTKTSALSLTAGMAQTISLETLVSEGLGYETPLQIEIANTGATDITDLYVYYYDGKNQQRFIRFSGAGFALGAGEKLTIDTETFYADIDGTSAMAYIYSGDFPVLTPAGTKWIKIKTAEASSVSVTTTFNVRWL